MTDTFKTADKQASKVAADFWLWQSKLDRLNGRDNSGALDLADLYVKSALRCHKRERAA